MERGTEFAMLTFKPLHKESTLKKLVNFFKDECGASMVEYGLLVALIAVVCILAVTTIGTNLSTQFTQVASAVGAAS